MIIILEGHFLTLKTCIASHWNRNHDITCISGDWQTRYGCPIWGHLSHPPRRTIREAYDTILDFMQLFPEQSFIIDRFHISQQYYDIHSGTHYYYKDVEKRLSQMGAIIVYLRNQFDNYEEALRCRLSQHHAQTVSYPKTLSEYRQQERVFTDILHRTSLPYIEYDVTGKCLDTIVCDLERIIKEYK